MTAAVIRQLSTREEGSGTCCEVKLVKMVEVFDVVVVGAGLMGSSAAYHAAKAGQRVLLLEQFALLHGNGSSHGSSRIFRVAYPDQTYTRLCLRSLDMWKQLEAEGGVQLIQFTGELDFAASDNAELKELKHTLATNGVPFEELTGTQANARFPGFSLPASTHAVFNPTAGVLNPTRAMKTLQRLAQQHGAEIRDRSKVAGIFAEERDGESLAVVELAGGASVYGKQAIVTAGAWTQQLLSSAGAAIKLQPIATFGMYWNCETELYTPDKFPVFIKYDSPEIYGMAIVDPTEGVKICRHDGPPVDPDARAGVTQPAEASAFLQEFVASHFSHVDASSPKKIDDCMYTMTEDSNFILDHLEIPGRGQAGATATTKRVVVGAGFSGHGAKMTPVIGQILADLAIQGETSHPIESFRINRPAVTAASPRV
jgi:sarcosine oxidase/L-pipecolate oxidase